MQAKIKLGLHPKGAIVGSG